MFTVVESAQYSDWLLFGVLIALVVMSLLWAARQLHYARLWQQASERWSEQARLRFDLLKRMATSIDKKG